MTPRRSVRAAAQRLFREMAGEGAPGPHAGTPLPNPPPQGGREHAVLGEGQADTASDLMAQVRRLYEETFMPVREIARRAGVSERTLYKYARKGTWKPRYAWMPDGARPPARPGRRRWTQVRERAETFAPEKGAGGRFVRRDAKGKPFAQGIKALDPAGRAAAAKASAEAARAAERARLEAECRSAWQAKLDALGWLNKGLLKLNRLTDAARKAGREIDPIDERCVWRQIDFAHDSWKFSIRDEQAAQAALEQFDRDTAAPPVTSACSPPS
jgi:hypothetical protein